jgi:hypothetical protein
MILHRGRGIVGAVIILLLLATLPTVYQVVRSPIFREQLAGDNWTPQTPVEQGIALAVGGLYSVLAWAVCVRAIKERWCCPRRAAQQLAWE